MNRVLLACCSLLFFGCPVEGQNEVRENRVWSLTLNIKYCGLIPVTARVSIWNQETLSSSITTPINAIRSIYQWSWEKDPEIDSINYRAIDIISEMGENKIFLLQVLTKVVGTGTATSDDKFITLTYWISPIGLNTVPIPPAPLRQFVEGNWNADDVKIFTNWFIANHRFSNKNIWRDVNKIRYKLDAGSEVNINVGTGSCIDM